MARFRYTPQALTVAIRAAKAGSSDVEIAEVLGCTRQTFYNLLKKNPEFSKSLEEARIPSEQEEDLEKLERRKEAMESWLDSYIETKGVTVETCEGPSPQNNWTKTKTGLLPDFRILSRILGEAVVKEHFVVEIQAAPENGEPYEEGDELL